MILPSPSPSPTADLTRPSLRLAAIVWLFVAVANITITAMAQSLKTGVVDWTDKIVWESGWIGWILWTFLIWRICQRFPIERTRRLESLLRLAGFGLGIVALQIGFDFLCNALLGAWLKGTAITPRFVLYIVAFKGHIYFGVFWLVVGAAHAFEYHARYLKGRLLSSQLQTKLATAELSLLKTQLQPHFLFNTHNSIISLMMKQDNPAAIRMLTRLSDLLRVSLSHSQRQEVSLQEEMATLRLYLDIQYERFRDRLVIEIDLDPELDGARVPHLLLQPLVENAMSHGLADVTEQARLTIRGRKEGDSLILQVQDNGRGFDPTAVYRSDGTNQGGVGLGNTVERLQQLYGDAQRLDIESAPGSGCTITIRIPFRIESTPTPAPS